MHIEHAIPLRFGDFGKRDLFRNPGIAQQNVNRYRDHFLFVQLLVRLQIVT